MLMPVGDSKPAASNSNSINAIHRKCDRFEDEKEDLIQRKHLSSNKGSSAQSPAYVQASGDFEARKSSGGGLTVDSWAPRTTSFRARARYREAHVDGAARSARVKRQ